MATGPVEQRNQDATCYVGNLDEQLSEELLWEMMRGAGADAPNRRSSRRRRRDPASEYPQGTRCHDPGARGEREQRSAGGRGPRRRAGTHSSFARRLQAGPIANVHMPRDKVTGMHQGYGFVEFRTATERKPCPIDFSMQEDSTSIRFARTRAR